MRLAPFHEPPDDSSTPAPASEHGTWGGERRGVGRTGMAFEGELGILWAEPGYPSHDPAFPAKAPVDAFNAGIRQVFGLVDIAAVAAFLLAVASRLLGSQCLLTAVVSTHRCGAVPDSHRIPSFNGEGANAALFPVPIRPYSRMRAERPAAVRAMSSRLPGTGRTSATRHRLQMQRQPPEAQRKPRHHHAAQQRNRPEQPGPYPPAPRRQKRHQRQHPRNRPQPHE